MINNNICFNCSKKCVCSIWETKLSKFDEDAKKDLGVTLTINSCLNSDEDDKHEE